MTGLWIPEEILRIEGLDFLSKGLFSQIVALSEKNPCYASNTYFAKMFGVTTRTISSSLSNLEQMKLIESKIDKANGNSRTIKVLENISIPNEKSSIPMENISIPMEKYSRGNEKSSIPMENISSQYKDESKVENKLKTNLKQSSNNDFQKNENLATAEKLEIVDLKGLTKKAPQAGGAGRKSKEADNVPELTFSESDLFDFGTFEAYMIEKYPEANVNYYYIQIRDWQNGDGSHPRRKNWKLVIKTFVTGDYAKGRLITKNHVGHEKTKQQSNQEQFADANSLVNQYLNSL